MELERVACFTHFRDILNTLPILRGKSSEDEESDTVGEFKGTMRVRNWEPCVYVTGNRAGT